MPTRTTSTGLDLSAAQRASLAGSIDQALVQEPTLQLFALLDIGQHPELHAFAEALKTPQASLFDGTPEAAAQVYSPRLVSVAARSDDDQTGLRERLLALTLQRPCVSWLLSTLSLAALADHLRGWLGGELLDDDGNELGEVMARFFDPRVLPGFMSMLSLDQKAELMRPIALWGLWLRSGLWHQWSQPADQAPKLLPRRPQYTSAQAAQLDAATRTDRMLARLEDQASDPSAQELAQDLNDRLLSLPHDRRFQRLDRIVQRAARDGLDLDADIQLYCTLALSVCEQFAEHPSVRAVVSRCAAGETTFTTAIADVTPDDWQAIEARSSWRRAPAPTFQYT
jgi:hypothetical protein